MPAAESSSLPLPNDHEAKGWPHLSHSAPPRAGNEPRHSSQMGTGLARSSTRSQSRQPAGKNTLTSASPAPESPLPTGFSRMDRPATPGQAYSVSIAKQREKVPFGKQRKNGMIAETNRDLQQTLLGFFLAVDAMLGPGYRF